MFYENTADSFFILVVFAKENMFQATSKLEVVLSISEVIHLSK